MKKKYVVHEICWFTVYFFKLIAMKKVKYYIKKSTRISSVFLFCYLFLPFLNFFSPLWTGWPQQLPPLIKVNTTTFICCVLSLSMNMYWFSSFIQATFRLINTSDIGRLIFMLLKLDIPPALETICYTFTIGK